MNGGKKRLLIVVGDMATGFALRALFGGQGWDVTLARTADEGFAGLSTGPDWIVIDESLPDDDGGELLCTARAWDLACRVAVIVPEIVSDRSARLLALNPDLLVVRPVAFGRLARLMDEPGEAADPAATGRAGAPALAR